MASESVNQPIIVIVGPTASGKTALGVRVAKKLGGEIISADSRTLYTDMNIGTAKPSIDERDGIPHYGFDLLSPGQRFTAADFQQYANKTIKDINARGRVPIIVGGTGLYVDAVVFNYEFGQDRDEALRAALNDKSIGELHEYCTEHSIILPENSKNKRHLIRAIEQNGVNHKRNSEKPHNFIIVGISADREVLQKRIEARAHTMFAHGVVNETKELAAKYGWESEAMTASIYRIVRRLLNGEISEREAIQLFIQSDMRLAKRQMTWFRRNPFIEWSDDPDELENKCLSFVNQFRG